MAKATMYVLVLAVVLLSSSYAASTAQRGNLVNDEDLKVVHFEDLRYPPAARMERAEGAVVVRVKLDEKGNVVESEAISGAKLLIPESLANAKKWSFQPNFEKAAVIVYNFRLSLGYCHTITSQFTFQPPNFATITSCEQPIQP
jgi:TonB family protein